MHRVSKLALGLSVMLGLGCAARMAAAQPQASQLPNDIQLRLAGSGTVGEKLTQTALTAWAKKIGLTTVRINPGIDPTEYEIVADRLESMRKLRAMVQVKGTGFGIEPLLRGQTDLWLASRQAKESDLDAMRKRNVPNVPTLDQFLAPGIENAVGLDAIAAVVHPRNPVKRLSISQMRDIAGGRTTNWSQLGGPNLPIGLYITQAGLGATDGFCNLVVGISDNVKCLESVPRLAAPPFALNEDVPDAIAGAPGGIGFSMMADKRNTRALAIGNECNTATDPEVYNVKTGEYPLTQRLFVYANPNRPLSPAARSYLDFLLSAEGQTAVANAGFADLSPSLSPEAYSSDRVDRVRDAQDGGRMRIRPADARAFEEAIGGGDRLSITFRFLAGGNELDARSEADVGRLTQLIQLPAYSNMQVVLIGYSGASGDYAEARALSRDRADAIRDRLVAQSGLKDVISLGIGPAAAVACNLDASTAPLNQRVEVWLRKRG